MVNLTSLLTDVLQRMDIAGTFLMLYVETGFLFLLMNV